MNYRCDREPPGARADQDFLRSSAGLTKSKLSQPTDLPKIAERNKPKQDRNMLLLSAHRLQIIRVLLRAALVLFILLLILPSVSKQQNFRLDLWCKAPVWEPGFTLLLFGPLAFLDAQFGWIANPLMLFAALIKIRKSGFALPAAILSAAIAAVALTVVTAFSYTRDWHDGGVGITVCGFGPGYYLWLACSILVLLATLLKLARRLDSPSQE